MKVINKIPSILLILFFILVSITKAYTQLSTNISKLNVNCLNLGSANCQVTGGNSPYTFLWSNGQNSFEATSLNTDIYYVTVSDNVGLTAIDSIEICEPTVSVSTTNETCYLNADGTVTATINCLDTASFSWTSNLGGGSFSVSPFASGLAGNLFDVDGNGTIDTAFTYIITVTDTFGCEYKENAYLRRPFQLTASTTNNGNGSATATPTGGWPPYTYLWGANTGGQTTQTAIGLNDSTSYSVTITDSENCSIIDSVSILLGTNTFSIVESFEIYPNPTYDNFQIKLHLQKKQNGVIEIRNTLGQLIQHINFDKQSINKQIEINSSANSIYLVSIIVNNKILTKKITILN